MYLSHFGLRIFPFSLTPNTDMFLGLLPHYEAIQTIIAAVKMGEGVIKVTGEVGTGKTMVCRKLMEYIEPYVKLVYLPNPILDGKQLQFAVAQELGLKNIDYLNVVPLIQEKLIDHHSQGQKTVLIVDEAQALSSEGLETLRLLGNLETRQHKLIQLVLFGQPELDARLEQPEMRQFRQRITFNCWLRTLSVEEGVAYINYRLDKAGSSGHIFSTDQKKAIWRSAMGTPRLINQISHKALLSAFHDHCTLLKNQHVFLAIHDTYDACKPKFKTPIFWGWSQF
ncbi:ExeA family protein [Vibrio sagamiensis]|uniref:MSHA biogenesis protein MshM n=1 Tax=Vibrio sagamiensis NBRC 104589 TaxID=1219064 RepID=A0A511QF75_9VIBR|nr:AAA family ATPase [Vibrio sagamiensis]PNQ69852.1 MSHA biogenesis protein MshM [Vibrio agarivorans]GEM75941.1 MSHA biogenesis protein MshM [Vibrio sagamiensis NBRC 104589]